jgi:hypothetical protein
MKKIALLLSALAFAALANEGEFEKSGFLTTAKCAAAGEFADCYLENFSCGSDGCFETEEAGAHKGANLVLFSHDDGKVYQLDTSKIPASELDEGVSRNMVTFVGEYDKKTNTIHATEFKAPPPPGKSFFKGCL